MVGTDGKMIFWGIFYGQSGIYNSNDGYLYNSGRLRLGVTMTIIRQEIQNETSADRAWLWYRILVWVCVLFLLINIGFGLFYGYRSYSDPYQYMFLIQFSLQLALLVSCIAAIRGKAWAAHAVRVTGVWYLALLWTEIPGFAEMTVSDILYGEPIYVGGAAELMKPTLPSYVYLLGRTFVFLVFLILVVLAHFVFKSRASSDTEAEQPNSTREKVNRRLFGAGVAGLIVGLIFFSLDVVVPPKMFATVIGSYFLIVGFVSLLIWHIRFKDDFLLRSAVSIAAILLIYQRYGAIFSSTVILWVPVLAFAVISTFKKSHNQTLRVTAFCFTVAIMSIALVDVYRPMLGPLRFFSYSKETTERPAEFPDYLIAPDGAAKVSYKGGDISYVSYVMHEAYPATKTLEFIADTLERAGWFNLEYDVMNPNFKSSNLVGWYNPAKRWLNLGDEVEQDNPDKSSFVWSAWWANNNDETISVHITQVHHAANKDELYINCTCTKYSSDSWIREYLENYKRIHQKAHKGFNKVN